VPPSLSVVIPSYNRPELLWACLETVTRHAPPATEVVVVDDGSPGGVAGRVASAFAAVRTVCLPRRLGFCGAANRGIQEAGAAVVEMLNDDTQVTAGWADAALPHFQDALVAAVAPLVLCLPPTSPRAGAPAFATIDSAGDRYYLGGVAGKRGHRRPVHDFPLQSCRVFGASASSAFFRRDALLHVGAFPESFGAYFEDVDLAFRLNRAGYRVWFEPGSRVLHHVSGSYGRTDRRLLARQSCNEERVFWRNLPAAALTRALPAHLAVLCAKAYRRWQEGNLLPFLAGRLRAMTEVRAFLRHRAGLRRLGGEEDWRSWGVETRYWA
jgi:GT2 family glycosyltransferase